jgi:hypothetical protein
LHFLIEMMCLASPRGVQTMITMRPTRNPIVWIWGLAVVLPPVLDIERLASEDERRIDEIEAAIVKGLGALGRIAGDPHHNTRTPNNDLKSIFLGVHQ